MIWITINAVELGKAYHYRFTSFITGSFSFIICISNHPNSDVERSILLISVLQKFSSITQLQIWKLQVAPIFETNLNLN
jgi:hypothetical protein